MREREIGARGVSGCWSEPLATAAANFGGWDVSMRWSFTFTFCLRYCGRVFRRTCNTSMDLIFTPSSREREVNVARDVSSR